MESYENKITFDLNETLLFELGQEIEEMISISLDPDIVVQSYDDYVQIRGVIMLSGEYFRVREDNLDMEQDLPERNVPSFRYVERVVNINRDVSGFSHRFPVEISVSNERVDNLNDIVVTVDSFDYKLPTNDTLNIFASLHIYGIDPEQKTVEESERRPMASASDYYEEVSEKQDVIHTDEQSDEKVDETIETNKDRSTLDEVDDSTNKQEIMEDFQEQPLRLIKGKKHDSDEELDSIIPKAEATEGEVSEVNAEQDDDISESTASEDEIQIELNDGLDEDNDEVNDVTFLTELFSSDEETYTQVKIYIAQKDDTVESIAKQYDIPVLQLLKDNRMSMDTIEEGQLITIRQRNTE